MRNQKIIRALGLGFVLCLFWVRSAKADELYGKIRGIVYDSSGAVVAGVNLTVTNADRGISRQVTSSGDGSYEFLQLSAPATYTLTAKQSGFRFFSARDIHLSLNQIYVLNVTLEVGAVTQEVTVEAAPSQVERTSMQLGRVLYSRQIEDLPLNGRNWITLQQTLPGVVSSDRFTNNYATNGSRSQANDFLVNGTDANDIALNTPNVIPSPDAIAEVSLITNTINPEYGRNGGAILSATTKAGNNQFHGDAFEFYRDNALNTRNFFSPSVTVFHQNQFGGVVGGPIKREKAFFFFSYQGTRNRQPSTFSSGAVTVFTTAQRKGDFSGPGPGGAFSSSARSAFPLVAEDGTTQPAGTLYSRLFPTRNIPSVDINPISAKLRDTFMPFPNTGPSTFQFNPVNAAVRDQYISRIDYNHGTNDAIFGYWYIEPSNTNRDLPFTGATVPGFGDVSKFRTQQYTLNWNHTFGSTMVNEARFGYQRLNFNTAFPQNPTLPSSLGFAITPQNTAQAGLPRIILTGFATLGFGSNGPQPRIDQTYQTTDNFSKIAGRHTFKAGFEMRRSQVSNPFFARNNGVFTFGHTGTFSTGNSAADFLLGIPDSYAQSSGNFIDARTQTYYSYGQDQFKIRPHLTLTYGAGWQIDTPLKNLANGGLAVDCFRPGQQSSVFPTSPAGLVFPGDPTCNSAAGAETRYRHFAPRFGFAWSPRGSQKWAVRGGYGIYYNRVEEELTLQFLSTPPFSLNSSGVVDAFGKASPGFANPFSGFEPVFDATGKIIVDATPRSIPNKFPFSAPKAGSAVDFTFFEPFSLNVFDPNLSDPYSQNYNLTVERELPSAVVLSVSYVGLQGRKLTGTIELNPAGGPNGNPICAATPGCNSNNNQATAPQSFKYSQTANRQLIFGGVGQQATFISSNFNALQVTVDKKPTHGLNFRATYGWSHSLDGGSSFEDLGFSNSLRGLDPFNFRNNYGDSAFDARHRFVISYGYDIPSVKHLSAFSRLPNRLTDGWRMTGIVTLQSGIPLGVADSARPSFTCSLNFTFYACWDRPDAFGPVQTFDIRTGSAANSLHGTISAPGSASDHYFFDPNAFGRSARGTLGNSGRNFFHGPGFNNVDFGLLKNTKINERASLQLRFEFFNLFNHAQFNARGVTLNANSSDFGRDLDARPTGIDSRLIQLAAKFIF